MVIRMLMAPSGTLLVSAALALGTAVGFALVGRRLAGRAPVREGRSAQTMFLLFWVSATVIWSVQGLSNLAAAWGAATLALHNAFDQVSTPFYCLAAGALLHYVLYLVTGRARLLAPILAYYLVLFFLLRWRVELANPVGVDEQGWTVAVEYATPLQSPSYTLLVALISAPLLASILIYGWLATRVADAPTRYRIALSSIGLFGWVGTEAATFALGLGGTSAGELTRRLVALVGMLLVLAAYQPPALLRARWAARASSTP